MSGDPKLGGWAYCRPAAWLRAVEFLPRPLSEDEAQTDLWVLNDVARQKATVLPGYRALATRWGWTTHLARVLVAGTPNLCLSPRGASRNGRAIVAHSRAMVAHSEPANAEHGEILEHSSRNRRAFTRNGRAPLPDEVVSSDAFEAPQKQTTEADDRLQTEETSVPQGAPPAAPPALGPADPDVEPDWDALFRTVPLTYDDEESDEQATDGGPVDEAPNHDGVEALGAQQEPPEVAPSVAVDVGDADPSRCAGVAGPREASAPGSLLTPRRRKAARPAPVGDVETLWEAWRAHGSVRGEPNDHRRRAMERVLRDYPLADVLEMLDAAHTGSTDNWRWLQGATSRSDAKYLKPENLLVAAKLAARMEDAAEWVEAGRPRHQVEETRAEARAEASTRSLATRATMAWDKTIVPHIGSRMDRLEAVMATWGDSPRAEEARRAVLGGLREAQGLSAIGMATQFTRPTLKRAFVRGFAAALGGTVTEAELREVG
jgi:hypothetical protein